MPAILSQVSPVNTENCLEAGKHVRDVGVYTHVCQNTRAIINWVKENKED